MIYGRGTGQKARGSAARQAADLRQLGNWLGAKDYSMGNAIGSNRVAYKRQASLEDAYGKARGGGQRKKAPKKAEYPTSYAYTEHKGTWSTSKKK